MQFSSALAQQIGVCVCKVLLVLDHVHTEAIYYVTGAGIVQEWRVLFNSELGFRPVKQHHRHAVIHVTGNIPESVDMGGVIGWPRTNAAACHRASQ